MNIVIHHNLDCGTSRNALQIIRDAGYAPTVIEYFQTGWVRPLHKEDGELALDQKGQRDG